MNLTKYKNYLKYSITLTLLVLFTGCSAVVGHKSSMNQFDNQLKTNKCDYELIDEKIEKDDDLILWGIQGGSLARNCFNYNKSNLLFDKVEDKYKESVDKDNIANNGLESTSSVLVNNNINDYEGNTYEKIMLNTYKALNFASLNDHQNARIEFNRALDRQRKAKEFFESEIKDRKAKTDSNTSRVANNRNTQGLIFKKYTSLLNDFDAYPDFINPFTTYMSGIYFLLNGDNTKARDLLKESVSMSPRNKQILADFKLSDKNRLKNSKEKYAWVIFENGQGMVRDEIKIDIPLYLVSRKVHYTGIALPKIVERPIAYKYLDVNGKKTEIVANMDNVIKTEFKKRFPAVVTEALINTVFKTLAQYQLNKEAGPLAGLAGALYQGLTNKADVRSWTALPKNFQSTRVKIDNNPIIIKNDKGDILKLIMIPEGKNAMIYVKTEYTGNDKIHEILF